MCSCFYMYDTALFIDFNPTSFLFMCILEHNGVFFKKKQFRCVCIMTMMQTPHLLYKCRLHQTLLLMCSVNSAHLNPRVCIIRNTYVPFFESFHPFLCMLVAFKHSDYKFAPQTNCVCQCFTSISKRNHIKLVAMLLLLKTIKIKWN
jgi:hypothetical protein